MSARISSAAIPDNIARLMQGSERKAIGKGARTRAEVEAAADFLSEKELQNLIAEMLDRNGVWYTRSRMDKKTTTRPGVPDFVLCVNGNFFAWEIKVGRNQPDENQIRELDEIRSSGGVALVLRSYEDARIALGDAMGGIKH